MNRYIYKVEKGMLMNGIEWEYSHEYTASTFEKAKDYIESYSIYFKSDPNGSLVQVNDNYWKQEIDFEERFGIMREELDQPYYWKEEDETVS